MVRLSLGRYRLSPYT